jgi:hypothetical protein
MAGSTRGTDMSSGEIAQMHVRRVGLMLFGAIPVTILLTGIVDVIASKGGQSYIDAILNGLVMAYYTMALWLIAATLIHTALTRGKSRAIVAIPLAMLLGLLAGLFAEWLAGHRISVREPGLAAWGTVAGGFYGILNARWHGLAAKPQ